MNLEEISIFSEARDLNVRQNVEVERLKNRFEQEGERIVGKFKNYQEEIIAGKESTGDKIQDWFVVNHMGQPIIDEETKTLIENWKRVYELSEKSKGQLVMILSQRENLDCVKHVMFPRPGEENEYVIDLEERREIGVLKNEIIFDIGGKKIEMPVDKYVVISNVKGREANTKEVCESISFLVENPTLQTILFGGFREYYALGTELKQRSGLVGSGTPTKSGLTIFFGNEVEGQFRNPERKTVDPEFYRIGRLLGVNVSVDFRASYQKGLAQLAYGVLNDVETLRVEERRINLSINEKDLIRKAERNEDAGYNDGERWINVPAKGELSKAQSKLTEVQGKIKGHLTAWKAKDCFELALPISLVEPSKGDVDLRERLEQYVKEYRL